MSIGSLLFRTNLDAYQKVKGKFGNKKPGTPCGGGYIHWRYKCSEEKTAVAKKRLKGTEAGMMYANRIRRFKDLEKVSKSKGKEEKTLENNNITAGEYVNELPKAAQAMVKQKLQKFDEQGKPAFAALYGTPRVIVGHKKKAGGSSYLIYDGALGGKPRLIKDEEPVSEAGFRNIASKASVGDPEWGVYNGAMAQRFEGERKQIEAKNKAEADRRERKARKQEILNAEVKKAEQYFDGKVKALKGKRQEVKVKLENGKSLVADATVFNKNIALHKSLGPLGKFDGQGNGTYTITHIPSSMAISSAFSQKEARRKVAAVFESGVDFSWPKITGRQNLSAIAKQLGRLSDIGQEMYYGKELGIT